MRFYSDYYYNLQVFQHYLTATMKDSKKSLIKSLNIFKSSPKNDNSLSTGKFMNNEITPFDVSQPCWAHPNQFLSHFCQNCEFKPLCGLCLHEGNHKNHIIRSIDKACKIVHRILTEILITIRAKSNLMQILEQHIQSRKKQLSNELDQYLQNINENFDHIQSCLQQKRHKIVQTIKKYYEVEENKIKQAERNAKQENEKLKTMIEILSEKAEKLQATSLCVYFYQKKQILQSNLEQGNKTYQQLKKMVPDLKWIIKSEVFEKLKNQINFLSIQIQKNQIQLLSGSPKKGNEEQKTKQKLIMNEKSLRGLKLEKKIRNQTKTSGFWTPKHVDSNKISQKILKQLREEKQLQKLISSESIQKLNKIDMTGIIKKGRAKKYPKDL